MGGNYRNTFIMCTSSLKFPFSSTQSISRLERDALNICTIETQGLMPRSGIAQCRIDIVGRWYFLGIDYGVPLRGGIVIADVGKIGAAKIIARMGKAYT